MTLKTRASKVEIMITAPGGGCARYYLDKDEALDLAELINREIYPLSAEPYLLPDGWMSNAAETIEGLTRSYKKHLNASRDESSVAEVIPPEGS